MLILSIIIPVYNGEKYLEKSLQSLISQTEQNFEVIIVDDGSTDSTYSIASRYCDEYEGFYCIKSEHKGVYEARNKGIEKAKGEYLLFFDCGDVLTDGAVEAISNCSEEYDADIISGRCWKNGDIEYEYERSLDILATQPEISKFESSLLQNEIIGAKAFRKKLFDLYHLRFANLSAHSELLFIVSASFKNVKISGCPEFILEKAVNPITDGYSPFETPTRENFLSLSYVINEILEAGRDEIIKETGRCDGDELYIQEILYQGYRLYIDNFYRRYWFMEPETISLMKNEFEKYAKYLKDERFRKMSENNPEIRLPYIYTDKKEAAGEPYFTILFDVKNEEDYLYVLRSIYCQTYPFFEVMVNEGRYNSDYFPKEFKNMENLVVLPDKHFHSEARKAAKSKICIEISDGDPLDIRALRETAASKFPVFVKEYVFRVKNRSLRAKKRLKDKGMIFNS